jgi:molybdopterin/thiamine biosynthesis adenylyltransferase
VDEQEALQAIDTALRQRGFKRDWSRTAHPHYTGPLERDGLQVTVSIEIPDLDFVNQPVIRLVARGSASEKRMPHIAGPNGELCYFARGSTVLDRYDPGGTVLRCLAQAEKVIGQGLRGRSDADFAVEFANYWGGSSVLMDLPPGFEGQAAINWIAMAPGDAPAIGVLALKEKLSPSFSRAHAKNRGDKAKPVTELCVVVRTERALGSDSDGRALPGDLKALSEFLAGVGDAAKAALTATLRDGKGLERWIAVQAPNAFCLAAIKIPKTYDKPEFMDARRRNLPETLASVAADIPVERYVGFPVDAKFLYERNLGDQRSLAGRKIALIGCGTIGGFLAAYLAQSGAGTLGGLLALFDRDVLMPSNLGRHLLGMPYLNRNKAVACADYIRSQFPHVDVEGHGGDALEKLAMLSNYDLVIDATGEEALSIALNHHAVRRRPDFPPTLFVWIAGNGGAAQAILCDGPDHACFKCQKPELAGPPRHRILRPEADNGLLSNAACRRRALRSLPRFDIGNCRGACSRTGALLE